MLFSSFEFLLGFLPAVFLCYYLLPPALRNPVLFVFSILFYGWGEPVFVFLMLATLIFDWLFGLAVSKNAENKKKKKLWLVVSVIFNLGILAFFKYFDFFASNVNALLSHEIIPVLGVSLPIGISFYTFQALSYVIDVYRGDAAHQKNPLTFSTYVVLFPQLIAGPIVRYKDIEGQLVGRTHSFAGFSSGVRRFVTGLGKKLLLADTAGAFFRYFSSMPDGERGWSGAWLGLFFFSFQIYFDFSGYSDMAIGLGRMFGFEFGENFNYPYTATSVTDFWRRWHISLSTWFRDYVYIPLGGNRVGKAKHILNLLTVWLLTGLWHGASWNFVLWGLYYFVFLVLEKYVWGKALEKAPTVLRRIYSCAVILFGWFIFASADISSPFGYLASLFSAGGETYDIWRSVLILIILALFSTPLPKKLFSSAVSKLGRGREIAVGAAVAAIFLLSLAALAGSDYSPFLYTRF